MNKSLRIAGLAAMVILMAGYLSWAFFVQPLRFMEDEGWILQAAIRHANGEGLTTSLFSQPDDLTTVGYRYLTWWPPFYPLAVSLLMQAGLPFAAAVKGVNAAALVLGVVGWLGLASGYLQRFGYLLLFALLLITTGSAIIPLGHTTDYLLWAALPYWFLLLLAARRSAASGRRRLYILGAAVLAGVLIGVRWGAAFLVPAGALALLPPGNNKNWRLGGRLADAALYVIPPALSFLGLSAVNRMMTGAVGTTVAAVQPWDFSRLRSLCSFEGCFTPLDALFTVPLGLETLLLRLWRAVEPAMASPWWSLVFLGLLPLALLAGLVWLWRFRGGAVGAGGGQPRELWLLTGIAAVTLVAFLAFMNVRFYAVGLNWNYLANERYYKPLWPAIALFWLAAAQAVHGPGWLRKAPLFVLALGVAYSLQALGRNHPPPWRVPAGESWERVDRVRRLTEGSGWHVVLDYNVIDYVLYAVRSNVVFRDYPDAGQAPRLYAGRPADLWLFRPMNEGRHFYLDPHYYSRRFEAVRERFGAEKVWTSPEGDLELYHARIGPEGEKE